MSNIKAVEIVGRIPFDCAENDQVCMLLGELNSPALGLRVHWGDVEGYRPNPATNGRTAVYGFSILGEEAVAFGYLDRMVKTLVEEGKAEILRARCRDVEEGGGWVDLKF